MNNKIKARLDQNYLESKRVHDDTLSKSSLIKRISEQNRIQAEKDRLYDLDNVTNDKETFQWDWGDSYDVCMSIKRR